MKVESMQYWQHQYRVIWLKLYVNLLDK